MVVTNLPFVRHLEKKLQYLITIKLTFYIVKLNRIEAGKGLDFRARNQQALGVEKHLNELKNGRYASKSMRYSQAGKKRGRQQIALNCMSSVH